MNKPPTRNRVDSAMCFYAVKTPQDGTLKRVASNQDSQQNGAEEKILRRAVAFGWQLNADARPYFIVGLSRLDRLSSHFLSDVKAALGVTAMPPETEVLESWYQATVRDDEAACEKAENLLDASGVSPLVFSTVKAARRFCEQLLPLLRQWRLQQNVTIDLEGS